MDKMVMIVYNEAMDAEVMEILGTCPVRSYTKITGVFGRGAASGTHLGNDIWPGLNNILYVVCPQSQSVYLLSQVKELKKKLAAEGIKAFVMPVEASV